jgi:hypothetical protein
MTITLPDFGQLPHFIGTVTSGIIKTAGYDPKTLVGLSGIMVVESATQYFRDQWNLPKRLSPFAAILIGVVFNILLALALNNDVVSSVYTGLITGALSSVWHEQTKS